MNAHKLFITLHANGENSTSPLGRAAAESSGAIFGLNQRQTLVILEFKTYLKVPYYAFIFHPRLLRSSLVSGIIQKM